MVNKDISYYQKIAGCYNTSTVQSQINDVQSVMLDGFEDSLYCKNVRITKLDKSQEDIKAIIYETFNYTIGCNSLYLIPKPGSEVQVGSLIEYNDSNDEIHLGKYIITESAFVDQMYWRYILIKVEYSIKVYKGNILYEIPCHITTGSRNYLNTKSDSFMILPSSRFIMYCPDWNILNRDDINKRFLLRGFAYKIVGIDTLTKYGILYMEVNEDVTTQDDNVELNIANYYQYQTKENQDICNTKNNYSVKLSPNISDVSIGGNITLTAFVYNNNEESNENVKFTINSNCDLNKCLTYHQDGRSLYIKTINDFKNIGVSLDICCELCKDSNVNTHKLIHISSLV